MKNIGIWVFVAFLSTGCAGTMRKCDMACSSEMGANWLVVQRDNAGKTVRCWKLYDVSIGDSAEVDGIYWQAVDGSIVHITGWFDRVQVESSWDKAAALLDVDLTTCK